MGSQELPEPVRLAILETDTPVPGMDAEYGGYGGVFTDLFRRALSPSPYDALLRLSVHHIVDDRPGVPADPYPDQGAIDAILITGSKHDAFEDDPWIRELVEYTRRAVEGGRVKVIGVCFGHQIVGRALGVPVRRNDDGWEVSATELKLSKKGKALFGKDTLKIHQMHRDAVFSYPAGAEALAATDVCPVQGMLVPGKAITVQGHPEFTESMVREILQVRYDARIISDEVFQSGLDRAADEHDGLLVAREFVRFLQE